MLSAIAALRAEKVEIHGKLLSNGAVQRIDPRVQDEDGLSIKDITDQDLESYYDFKQQQISRPEARKTAMQHCIS